MISSGRYRASFHITIADIFQDFNDPRKDTLGQRVQIALEEQERRLKSELDDNNLANLQILIKKQQLQKKLEDTIANKQEEVEQVKAKLQCALAKIKQFQKQKDQYQSQLSISQEKINCLEAASMKIEEVLKQKDIVVQGLRKEIVGLKDEVERLDEQNKKYEAMISSLKANYSRKMEEIQYIIKIRENKIKDQYNENIEQIRTKNALQKSRQELQRNLTPPKRQNCDRKIQCELLRPKETPRKPPPPKKEDCQVQTEELQVQAISQLLQQGKNEAISERPNLDEVRLIYSRSIQVQTPMLEPKVTKYFNLVFQNQQCQTDESHFQQLASKKQIKKISKQTQANLYVEDRSLKEELRKQREKHEAAKQSIHQSQKIIAALKKEVSASKGNVEQLRLKLLQLEFELEKKEYTMSVEREMLTQVNKQLQMSQNQLIIRKFSGKSQMAPFRKPIISNTCSTFIPRQKIIFGDSDHNGSQTQNFEQSTPESMQESVQVLSPRNWEQTETNVITIIRKAHNLRFLKPKRHSLTEQSQTRAITTPRSSFLKRNTRKYSQPKKP